MPGLAKFQLRTLMAHLHTLGYEEDTFTWAQLLDVLNVGLR
jgi:hypothetical protein